MPHAPQESTGTRTQKLESIVKMAHVARTKLYGGKTLRTILSQNLQHPEVHENILALHILITRKFLAEVEKLNVPDLGIHSRNGHDADLRIMHTATDIVMQKDAILRRCKADESSEENTVSPTVLHAIADIVEKSLSTLALKLAQDDADKDDIETKLVVMNFGRDAEQELQAQAPIPKPRAQKKQSSPPIQVSAPTTTGMWNPQLRVQPPVKPQRVIRKTEPTVFVNPASSDDLPEFLRRNICPAEGFAKGIANVQPTDPRKEAEEVAFLRKQADEQKAREEYPLKEIARLKGLPWTKEVAAAMRERLDLPDDLRRRMLLLKLPMATSATAWLGEMKWKGVADENRTLSSNAHPILLKPLGEEGAKNLLVLLRDEWMTSEKVFTFLYQELKLSQVLSRKIHQHVMEDIPRACAQLEDLLAHLERNK